MSAPVPRTNFSEDQPLQVLEQWDDFLNERYPEPDLASGTGSLPKASVGTDPEKKKEQFRNYEADARPTVREFYRLNHLNQTYGLRPGEEEGVPRFAADEDGDLGSCRVLEPAGR